MSYFAKQQKKMKELSQKERTRRETLSKFFYDLAKLVFASMALVGGISLTKIGH